MSRLILLLIFSGWFACVLGFGQIVSAQNLESLPNPDEPGNLVQDELKRIQKPLEGLRPDQQSPERNPIGNSPQRRKRTISIIDWLTETFGPDVYKSDSGDDELTRLKKERINTCLVEMGHFKRLRNVGVESLDIELECQERLFKAQLDFHAKPKEIIAVLERAVESAKLSETILKDQFDAGSDVNIAQVSRSKYFRLDCEINLLKAKQKYGLVEDSAAEKKEK